MKEELKQQLAYFRIIAIVLIFGIMSYDAKYQNWSILLKNICKTSIPTIELRNGP